MQQRLQHAAAHGQRLIRGGGAVGGLSPGVHIAAFHAGEYLQSRLQQSPEAAIDGADHGNTVYGGGDVSGPDQLSNFHAGCKDTCRRCPEYPLGAFAADLAGNAGVGQRTAAVQRSPQRVAPHGFHGGVAVNADGEAGADASELVRALSLQGQRSVVLTGYAAAPGQVGALCYDRDTRQVEAVQTARVPQDFPGTGDLFASVLTGALTRGAPLLQAARTAVDFVGSCVARSVAEGAGKAEGVDFEPLLRQLTVK